MTTSGTVAFGPDVVELIEEAFEIAGTELRNGYQLRTARRSLDLLMLEWANRGLNLWTVEASTFPTVAGTTTYNLGVDTVDIIEANVLINNDTEYPLARISAVDYMAISNKATRGRPNRYWLNRTATPVLNLWMVPDQVYTVKYWRLRRMQDSGGSTYTPDIPFRFLPALIAGLALRLAAKTPDAAKRVPYLEAEYEKQFSMAQDEDREKNSFFIRAGRRR